MSTTSREDMSKGFAHIAPPDLRLMGLAALYLADRFNKESMANGGYGFMELADQYAAWSIRLRQLADAMDAAWAI